MKDLSWCEPPNIPLSLLIMCCDCQIKFYNHARWISVSSLQTVTLHAVISKMPTHFLIEYLSWKQHASIAESQSQRGKGKMAICQLTTKIEEKPNKKPPNKITNKQTQHQKQTNKNPNNKPNHYLLYSEVIICFTAMKKYIKMSQHAHSRVMLCWCLRGQLSAVWLVFRSGWNTTSMLPLRSWYQLWMIC